VNESRVSQLHARAIRRLREALGTSVPQAEALHLMRSAILEFHKPKMAKASLESRAAAGEEESRETGVVVGWNAAAAGDGTNYASVSRTARSKSPSRNGFASQRQPESSRKRSASVPATSPVTKITRRASVGVAAAIAR